MRKFLGLLPPAATIALSLDYLSANPCEPSAPAPPLGLYLALAGAPSWWTWLFVTIGLYWIPLAPRKRMR